MIGLSLSFCVRDIADGTVKEADVAIIVAGTGCPTLEDWDIVLEGYASVYWLQHPERSVAIARRLIAAGKIYQPKLEDPDKHPHLGNGPIWVEYDDPRLAPYRAHPPIAALGPTRLDVLMET